MSTEEIFLLIDQFFNSPQFIALLSALISYFAANFLTILGFVISNIKAKNKARKQKDINDVREEAIKQEYQKKLELFYKDVDSKINRLQVSITGKIDEQAEQKKKIIEEQSVQLKTAISEVKKNLSIDELLEDK